ncbi:hypothetical protein M9Y10_040333 [Tritrichomonas musculus]|uniref:Myb-like DNA-binding domain containing protein n=1 Tax=Tritrichomonas musculus TaxID=1915356 RepID=A0ABR2GPS4_9EUKA
MYQTMQKFNHKQKFTKTEDAQLIKLVKKYGVPNWEEVSRHMKRRNARQCRERYNNYLNDNFKKGSWTESEDKLIISLYRQIGPHWLNISKSLPGRSGNDIKNRWHKTLSKKIDQYDGIPSVAECANIEPPRKVECTNITSNENVSFPENGKRILKSEIENQSYTKSSQIRNGSVIRLFEFYETTGRQWNMFPNEEEKKLRFDHI